MPTQWVAVAYTAAETPSVVVAATLADIAVATAVVPFIRADRAVQAIAHRRVATSRAAATVLRRAQVAAASEAVVAQAQVAADSAVAVVVALAVAAEAAHTWEEDVDGEKVRK